MRKPDKRYMSVKINEKTKKIAALANTRILNQDNWNFLSTHMNKTNNKLFLPHEYAEEIINGFKNHFQHNEQKPTIKLDIK